MVKAIVVREYGGPEVMKWEDVTLGDPGPGEARVKHAAIGLNFVDIYNRTGLYKPPGACRSRRAARAPAPSCRSGRT